MKLIAAGITCQLAELVTDDKSASRVGSGLLDVYSTPAMIALMEKASYLCVQEFSDENETTVGGAVNIRHMKPTAIGKTVVCKSTVIEVKDTRIEFEVEVKEDEVVIGKGMHTRFVIDKSEFVKNL